jgi:hypothetical protein
MITHGRLIGQCSISEKLRQSGAGDQVRSKNTPAYGSSHDNLET